MAAILSRPQCVNELASFDIPELIFQAKVTKIGI